MSASSSYAGGLLTTNYNYAKLFIWNNRYNTASYTNATGSPVTLTEGRLMGRVIATNKVYPQVSTATDGSQVPVGVLKGNYTVADGVTVTVTFCDMGDVDAALLGFGASDTLATPILFNSSVPAATTTQYGTIGDILLRAGIVPVTTTENTRYDN